MSTFISRNISQLPKFSVVCFSIDLSKRLKASFGIVIDTAQRIPNRLIAFMRRVSNHRIKAVIASTKKAFALFREMVSMDSFLVIGALKSGNLIGERGSTIYILEIPAGSVTSLKASKNAVMLPAPTSACFYNTVEGRLRGFKHGSWAKLLSHAYPLAYTAG